MIENPIILYSGEFNILNEFKCPGIYGISGLAPSSFETPIYVGSAENVRRRICKDHFPQLTKDEHINLPLQNYFNKNGLNNLVIFLMETCSKESLLSTEQKYLDYYGVAEDARAFNIARDAKASMRGRRHSKEAIEKLSKIRSGTKMSEETKNNMAKAQLGRKHSKETKTKMKLHGLRKYRTEKQKQSISEKNAESFFALDINSGFIFEFRNLKKFCRENNISSSNFLATRKQGRRKRCKNWVLMDKNFAQ